MEGTYEDTNSRVLCRPGTSVEVKINVGLRQGSALTSLWFIAVVELISRKTGKKNLLRKLVYADDLAIEADGEADVQGQLAEWKISSADMD